MLGSIIGDIAGSFYEVEEILAIKNNSEKKRNYEDRIKILDINVPLFNDNDSYTDDSILTTAIADALINNRYYENYLKKYGKREINLGLDKYGRSRFGKGFITWLNDNKQGVSYGNGSAMRIAPIAYYFDNLDDIHENAIKATIPSHNNKEAIDGALAVCDTIFLARKNYSKDKIKEYIEKKYNYNLNFNLNELQKNYTFSSKCINSVPQAIYCFLISNDFEDAIRKSISIGGDSDTIACIVGGISEAYYGIPNQIKEDVQKYIPEYIKNILNQFYLNLEFIRFMRCQKQFNNDFEKYIEKNIRRLDSDDDLSFYGCFPIIENNILKDIKLLVPTIKNEKTILVNVHEYKHAMDLYEKLNEMYIENRDVKEMSAKELEKRYIKEKKNGK